MVEMGQIKVFVQESVCLSRPSLDRRARLDRRLWKIARLMPIFLWFCPSICDFVHIQSVIELFGTVKLGASHVHCIKCTVGLSLPLQFSNFAFSPQFLVEKLPNLQLFF